MHDTEQLKKCCSGDEDIQKTFLNVFAADQIPKTLPEEFCFIANTDPAHLPGTHWIAVGKKKNHVPYFFDSYGLSPTSYQAGWARFDAWSRSHKNLQQLTSDVCGDYCLYFCKCFTRLRRNVPELILKYFSEDDSRSNDETVCEVIHKEYPRFLNSIKHRLGSTKKDKDDGSASGVGKYNQMCR